MTALSITVNAIDIPDMASQLAQLAARFNGIARLIADDPNPSLNNAPSSTQVLAATPLEEAIAEQKDDRCGQQLDSSNVSAEASNVVQPKVKAGRKPAANKAAAAPKDRMFDEETGGTATITATGVDTRTIVGTVDTSAGAGEGHYTDDMPDEDCFTTMRARAKEIVDDKGLDTLKGIWNEHWAAIAPHAADQPPGIKHLEGNRPAILRALAVFDAVRGIDPATGEAGASDPAADLL